MIKKFKNGNLNCALIELSDQIDYLGVAPGSWTINKKEGKIYYIQNKEFWYIKEDLSEIPDSSKVYGTLIEVVNDQAEFSLMDILPEDVLEIENKQNWLLTVSI